MKSPTKKMTTANKKKGGSRTLRVLFVEDSKRDADYLAFLLRNEGFALIHERVDTAEAMERALKNATWDVVISDHRIPDFGGPEALKVVRKIDPDVPFVVVSGAVGEEVGLELMKAGASDFVSKANPNRLVPVIERELREARERQERKRAVVELQESEARYRGLFENSLLGISRALPNGRLVAANQAYARMYGYASPEQMMVEVTDVGRRLYANPNDREEVLRTLAEKGIMGPREFPVVRRDGSLFFVIASAREIRNAKGQLLCYQAEHVDVTERKRAEERIRMFSRQLLAVREEEKKRVSSALHHDVGSLAVGLSAHLDAIEADVRCGKMREALKGMKTARKLFDESVDRLKRVAVELRPPELDLLGLSAALRHHFSQVTARGNIRIHFTETLGRRRMPDDVATVVFRIVQEALTNAVKHGHARKVDVKLSASAKELSVEVRNDGKGFRPAKGHGQRSSHLGLHMMEEMAAAVGGTFVIDSAPGNATVVRAVLPLVTVRLGGSNR